MEINASTPNPVNNNPSQQPNINDELKNKDPDAILSSESTVNVSPEARNLSAQDEQKPTTQATSEEQAKLLVEDFQKSAVNDSSLTLQSQSSTVTPDVVRQILG
ncbi:MAG: hypothetical protein ACKE51_01595 [Methylococcaceae bacterium]